MPMVTLDEVKLHCKVGGTAEDALLQTYIAAAEGFVTRYCGQDFEENVPPVVKVACLMVVAGMYENRQSAVHTQGNVTMFRMNDLLYYYLDQHRVNRGIA